MRAALNIKIVLLILILTANTYGRSTISLDDSTKTNLSCLDSVSAKKIHEAFVRSYQCDTLIPQLNKEIKVRDDELLLCDREFESLNGAFDERGVQIKQMKKRIKKNRKTAFLGWLFSALLIALILI